MPLDHDLINRARKAFEALADPKFDFVYYAMSQSLVGDIAGEGFVLEAFSGGGRGRTRGEPDNTPGSFDPTRPSTRDQRGGVLPPGIWKIEKPSLYVGSKRPPISRLIPVGGQRLQYSTRDFDEEQFLIQGPEPRGSGGCIVIDRVPRRKMLAAVERAGGAFLLVTMDFPPPGIEAAAKANSQAG
jgi:hypothetical protein